MFAASLLSSHHITKNINIKMYGFILVCVVLYGCDIWSVILREGHRLRVFEDRALKTYLDIRGRK
jgi:hypothetical protein